MNISSLLQLELTKIRRSKIFYILLAPIILMWLPSIINANLNFNLQGIPITPEHNFFIQAFMGMAWFMIPATLVICAVLLSQIEYTDHGMTKMLTLPLSMAKLSFVKFSVLLLMAMVQMFMLIISYYLSAFIITQTENYNFILDPFYICKNTIALYIGAIPMAAIFWTLAILIRTPIFSVGLGLASIVPSVLMINTKFWFIYPMSYPFYLLMVEYGKAAEGIYTTQIDWLPWLPIAIMITVTALAISTKYYGFFERK